MITQGRSLENKKDNQINLFYATGFFLYPMETSEILWFSDISGSIERDQWLGMGYQCSSHRKTGKLIRNENQFSDVLLVC